MTLSQGASAQSPINIDQLLAKASTWQVSSSFDYRGVSFASVQRERRATFSTGIRYGLTRRFELNGRFSASEQRQEFAELEFRQKTREVNLGANWLIKAESALPALLLEARAVIHRNGSTSRKHLPEGRLGITTYKSLDPVVLSLSAAMTIQRDYRLAEGTVEPGVAWRIEPGVNFAVNANVTLFGGVSIERRNASSVNGDSFADQSERVVIRGGIALAVAGRHSVFVSGDIASDHQGGMNLQWFYEF
ncbi:hypothetical protein R0137_09545 [Congregibacter brevis]|uniref:MetA-pathway of phenol degradation n=1 Tax=Congregibacter brevis TaxID=3081201 RepID=A0ABZ0I7L2_9GAMM|nr:hypothetical protein R0137_09545 [Congregibacter sp. IMCC45268]